MPTDWAQTIAAAASPWGLAALMVLIVGALAMTQFRAASSQVRLVSFVSGAPAKLDPKLADER